MDDRDLVANIKFKVDQGSATQASAAAKGIKSSIDGIEQGGAGMSTAFTSAAAGATELGEALGPVVAIALVGVTVIGGMVAALMSASQAAAQFYGQSNESSARWVAANKQIEDSTNKLNLVIQQGMVIPLELAAKLAQQVAGKIAEIEKNGGGPGGPVMIAAIAKRLGINIDPVSGSNPANASSVANKSGAYSDKNVMAYVQWARQQNEAQIAHQNQLDAQQRTFYHSEQIAQQNYQHTIQVQEKEFYHQREVSNMQFSYQQNKATADYNYSVMVSNRSYYRDRIKAEADFQRQLRWMNIDHQHNMAMAAMTNDAFSMIQEQYSYEVGKARAQDDFNYQKQWADQEHAWQLSDQQEAFNREQAIRQQDYSFQQSILKSELDWKEKMQADQFAYDRKKAAENFAFQKQENEIAYDQQREAQRRALIYQLTDMQEGILAVEIAWHQMNQFMITDLGNAFSQIRNMGNGLSGARAGATVSNSSSSNSVTIGGINFNTSNTAEIFNNIFGTITQAMTSAMR